MAKREYRDKTGKLLGYSQNESDRTGIKGPKGLLIFILFMVAFGIAKHFHWI
ncbi:MAG: hypothetical protein WDM91_07190 [Rhizomicrobium sp.]